MSSKTPPPTDENILVHPADKNNENTPTNSITENTSTKKNDPNTSNLPRKVNEKNKKGRCAHGECRKKIKLMGFDCKCKLRFCISHLPAEVHNCTYDYKSEGQNRLKETNQPIVPTKVPKI